MFLCSVLKNKFNSLLIIISVTILAWYYAGFVNVFIGSMRGIPPDYNASYSLSEWLINYEGGFVGRGFAGQMFRLFSNQSFLYPTINVFVHVVGLIVTLTLLLILIVRSSKLNVKAALIFLLHPAGMPLILSYTYCRKEMLFHVITILHLVIVRFLLSKTGNYKSLYIFCSILLFTLLGSAAALTHESYIFLCLPINCIITLYFLYSIDSIFSFKRAVNAILIHVLPIICCVAAFLNKGNPAIAQSVWKSISQGDLVKTVVWEYSDVDQSWIVAENSSSAILALGTPLSETINGQLNLIFSSEIILWTFIITTSLFYVVEAGKTYMSAEIGNECAEYNTHELDNGILIILMGLFICSSPLYLLATDYGRFLSSIVISFMLVILTVPNVVLFISNISSDIKVIAILLEKAVFLQENLQKYLWPDSNKLSLKFIILILWLSCIKVNICYPSLISTLDGSVPKIVNDLINYVK